MNDVLPIDNHEECRLAALQRYCILATSADSIFDSITAAASIACDTPVSLIGLVGRDRQWFKSSIGFDRSDMPRDIAFCSLAILNPLQIFEIEDASQDKRYQDNPLVAGAPHTKFFAAMPLRTPDGFGIGALCVSSNEPKVLNMAQRLVLKKLANLVIYLLEANYHSPESAIGSALDAGLPRGLVITDQSCPDHPILFCNKAFEHLSGYSTSEIVGKKCDFLQSEQDRADSRVVLENVMSNHETITLIQKNYHKDATLYWNEVTYSPCVDELNDLIYYLGAMDDVSARVNSQSALEVGYEKLRKSIEANAEVSCKLADSNLALQKEIARRIRSDSQSRKLQAELIHIARVTTMGGMATGLVHELYQPLFAVSLSADTALAIARKHSKTDADLIDCLVDIRTETLRAGEIIRALRQFISRDKSNRVSMDINELVCQTVSLFSSDVQSRYLKIVVVEGDVPQVLADRVQIAQVLVNLIRNSLDSMSGRLSLGGERRVDVVSIETTCVANNINVSVTDSGPGFDVGIEPFKAYETSKEDGLGIGLSICRSIIESHNGEIWLDKNSSTGCQVRFTLEAVGLPG